MMPSHDYILRKKEEFRFFDDLHPRLRQFVREANYEWDPIPIMSQQHACQGNDKNIEDLYEDYCYLDQQRFSQRMTPKLRQENKEDEPTAGNGQRS